MTDTLNTIPHACVLYKYRENRFLLNCAVKLDTTTNYLALNLYIFYEKINKNSIFLCFYPISE